MARCPVARRIHAVGHVSCKPVLGARAGQPLHGGKPVFRASWFGRRLSAGGVAGPASGGARHSGPMRVRWLLHWFLRAAKRQSLRAQITASKLMDRETLA